MCIENSWDIFAFYDKLKKYSLRFLKIFPLSVQVRFQKIFFLLLYSLFGKFLPLFTLMSISYGPPLHYQFNFTPFLSATLTPFYLFIYLNPFLSPTLPTPHPTQLGSHWYL